MTAVVVSAGVAAGAMGVALDDAESGTPGVEGVSHADALQRDLAAERPGRGDRPLHYSTEQPPRDAWLLPLHGYRFTSPFGRRVDPITFFRERGVDVLLEIEAIHG